MPPPPASVKYAHTLVREQWVPQPIDAAFAFFSDPANLQALTPPWLDFRITESPAQLQVGSLIRYKLRWHGLPVRWTTRIAEWQPPHRFVDIQLSGPYALWHHQHQLTSAGAGTSIRDEVTYALPLGALGNIAHSLLVRKDVERIFDYRIQRMRQILGS
jgi:ligand-binding SRPBCC domain-containing protein